MQAFSSTLFSVKGTKGRGIDWQTPPCCMILKYNLGNFFYHWFLKKWKSL